MRAVQFWSEKQPTCRWYRQNQKRCHYNNNNAQTFLISFFFFSLCLFFISSLLFSANPSNFGMALPRSAPSFLHSPVNTKFPFPPPPLFVFFFFFFDSSSHPYF